MAFIQVGGVPVSSTAPFPVTNATLQDMYPAIQTISAADTVSSSASGYNGQVIITGAPTLGSVATFALNTNETINVQVTGSLVGTLVAEYSIDGGTTWARQSLKIPGSPNTTSTINGFPFIGLGLASGRTNFRMRCTVFTSGTAAVRITLSSGDGVVYGAGSSTIADPTLPNVANVKAGSTAAAAGDAAMVVALSPNSNAVSLTFPASQAVTGSVAVTNLPATQPVSGSVAVTNLPGTQAVSGAVSVTNLPATQTVAGSVTVSNLPATQPVSGSVSVSNFPANQDAADVAPGSALPSVVNVSAGYDGSFARAVRTDTAGNTTSRSPAIASYYAVSSQFTPVAGDIFQINGSSTKLTKILRIYLSGVATTAGGVQTIALIKRSTANTGGTSAALTAVPADSTSAAATASARNYTAAPTLGTVVGTVYQPRVVVPALATTTLPGTVFDLDLSMIGDRQPLVLRNASEGISINLSAVPTGAATFQVGVLWTEE